MTRQLMMNLLIVVLFALSFVAASCSGDDGNPPDPDAMSDGFNDSEPTDAAPDTMSDDTSTPNPDTESPPDTNTPPEDTMPPDDPCEAYEAFAMPNTLNCCSMDNSSCSVEVCELGMEQNACTLTCPEITQGWTMRVDDESYFSFGEEGDREFFIIYRNDGSPRLRCFTM